MSDNLDKYLPEFNEDDIRSRLTNFTREQLTDMLVYAYKEKRVIAKYADEQLKKLDRIEKIVVEPSNLVKMPGIPTTEDIRRMMEDEG
jgi:hypothetical protein